MVRDLEKGLDPVDERRYENARWWRSLNRLMSIVGMLIIAAIVRSQSLEISPKANRVVDRSRCHRHLKIDFTHD